MESVKRGEMMKPEPLTNLRRDLELKTKEANEELEILLNTLLTGGTDNKEEALDPLEKHSGLLNLN